MTDHHDSGRGLPTPPPGTLFHKDIPGVGVFSLYPMRIPEDVALVHDWVSRSYARYWGMQDKSREEVADAYREILRPPGSQVFIGVLDGHPVFLMEWYRPAEDPIGKYYDVRPGDHGMHVLVAPTERPIPQFTWHVFTVILDFMFNDPSVERIVVEPDVRNEKIHRLNRRAGFEYQRILQLPKKTAYLAFCTRSQYAAALARAEAGDPQRATDDGSVSHLTAGIWTTINAQHLRKIISELSHELVLQPRLRHEDGGWGYYTLATDSADIEYRFRARVLPLEHWHIDVDSIEKLVSGERAPLDSLSFVAEARESIGLSAAALPTYMEEITATLYSAAYKHANQRFTADELARADFQDVESSMTEGHPSFIANNGRVGFDLLDYQRYAPEAGAEIQLVWVAAHRERATFSSISDLSYEQLVQEELGVPTVAAFDDALRARGLDPDTYLFMPVHPWQWANKLAHLFAPDIASQRLVYLGRGEDRYQAQQSIRTLFNLSAPHKRYVKMALSILNMGFMRGLSADYMANTPAINEWVHDCIQGDAFLRERGFAILREVASIGYRHGHYESALTGASPYKKMLAALWRESPVPALGDGERPITMAALLHRDRDGEALLPALIRHSGLTTEAWLQRYFACYLTPLVHCFFAHGLVFMPHGENIILVLRDHVPVRAFMKDIGEEVGILDGEPILPEQVKRIAITVPEELKTLSIFTDLFDSIFRFVADILSEQGDLPPQRFWCLVAESIIEYQQAHPALADTFRRLDLFVPEFTRSCLNRLQLANHQQMLDLADPTRDLQFAGTLKNPVALHRPAEPTRRSS